MWSKRKEDELPQRPERPVATPGAFGPGAEPQRREISTMSTPTRTFEPEAGAVRSGSAALGKNVTVKGQIVAREGRLDRIHQPADPLARVAEHVAIVHADPGIDHRMPPGPMLY